MTDQSSTKDDRVDALSYSFGIGALTARRDRLQKIKARLVLFLVLAAGFVLGLLAGRL